MRDYSHCKWNLVLDDAEITLVRAAIGLVAENASDLNDRYRAEAILQEIEEARQRALQLAVQQQEPQQALYQLLDEEPF